MVSEVASASPYWLGAVSMQVLGDIPLRVLVGLAALAAVLIVLVIFTVRVALGARRIHRASAEGRRISAAETGPHPVTNYTRNGVASDPLNVKIIATDVQMATAFATAGWYRADEIDSVTSLRITFDAILGRKYASAPVSNLYLYGRRQDYAFEHPGRSVRERDHVRFWDTGQRDANGRPTWIGGATRDCAVEISKVSHLPTHKIAPDVDTERGIVAHDLIGTGWVVEEDWEPGFGKPTQTHNAMEDPYYTDGQVAVLTLANVPSLLPLATQVRGRLSARIIRRLSRAGRWRLPKSGRSRAKAQKHREREPAAVTTSSPDAR
jgi:LssY C-terminus